MPPVILWAIGLVGAMMLGKWISRETTRVNDELHPREGDPAPVQAESEGSTRLVRDPNTGEYRPER